MNLEVLTIAITLSVLIRITMLSKLSYLIGLKDTIIKYFMKFPESVRQLVRTVSCDLNSYYVDIAKTLLPNAKIIIDRFHIVQMLNRALNSMRTDLMNNFEHSSKTTNYLSVIGNYS